MANDIAPSTRAENDLSHLIFTCGEIGRVTTLSTIPVLAGDSFQDDMIGSMRLSQLRRGLVVDSKVDIVSFYIPHRHIYGDDWMQMMEEGVNSTVTLPSVSVGSAARAKLSFLGITSSGGDSGTTAIPKWLWDGYWNIWNEYFRVPWLAERRPTPDSFLGSTSLIGAEYGESAAHLKNIWTAPLPDQESTHQDFDYDSGDTGSMDIRDLQKAYGQLQTEQERELFAQRYRDVMHLFGGSTPYDGDNRPEMIMKSTFWASGYDVDGTDQSTLGQFSGRVQQSFKHRIPRKYIPEHGVIWTVAVTRFPPSHMEERHYLVQHPSPTYEEISGDPAIVANEPPMSLKVSDLFDTGSTGNIDLDGRFAFGQWYRYQPDFVHTKYREIQGFPFLDSTSQITLNGAFYVNPLSYDDCFQTTQLGHWNIQARSNAKVFRQIPTTRDSAMTS